ncbi:hypothetical protein GN956_G16765 [Arapaima gigas]
MWREKRASRLILSDRWDRQSTVTLAAFDVSAPPSPVPALRAGDWRKPRGSERDGLGENQLCRRARAPLFHARSRECKNRAFTGEQLAAAWGFRRACRRGWDGQGRTTSITCPPAEPLRQAGFVTIDRRHVYFSLRCRRPGRAKRPDQKPLKAVHGDAR